MILTELLVATRETLLPGLANQIKTSNPTIGRLIQKARYQSGAAGAAIGVNAVIARNAGRYYRGSDGVVRERVQKLRRFFAQWHNLQEDIVLDGTELEENIGVTLASLIESGATLRGTQNRMLRETLVNLVRAELEGANDGAMNMKVRNLWGKLDTDEVPERAPDSLDELFDENGSFHGMAPDALGTFPARDPWGSSSGIVGQNSTNIWEPRIHTFGAPTTPSRDAFTPIINRMELQFPGERIAPSYPDLFWSLASEFDANARIELNFTGTIELTVTAVKIGQCIFYPDDWAPTDKIRCIHTDTYRPTYWRAPGAMVTKGVPYYMQELARDDDKADAASSALQAKYGNVCSVRGAQLEFRNLQ